MIRRSLVLLAAAASLTLLITSVSARPAGARPAGPPGSAGAGPDPARPGSGGPGAGQAPRLARPGVIPAGPSVRMSADQESRAAARCASWASKAGFANDGRAGRLVVAVAIALAESGCDSQACLNDTTHRECTRQGTRHSRDSIDRGAWQINSHFWPGVSNRCAYDGLCSARTAYRQISARGTYFKPWETFITGIYKRFLPAARAGVRSLRTGTLTSAYTGLCAFYPRDHRRERVRLGRCGSAARDQMWTRTFAKLRTHGHLCLGAQFRRSGPVTVQRCSGTFRQQWWGRAGSTLYNRGARQCLTAPGSPARAGYALRVGPCRRGRDRAWYRP